MKFLIDEDLPRSVGNLLQRHGHEAVDIRDTILRGANDAEVAEYAHKHKLCLLSGDVGFADIRNYPPGKYWGIIVLRLPARATSSIILSLLSNFLLQADIVNDIRGKLAILEFGRVRIRRE